jgi:hypothetical protein
VQHEAVETCLPARGGFVESATKGVRVDQSLELEVGSVGSVGSVSIEMGYFH